MIKNIEKLTGLRIKYQEDFKAFPWWNTSCNCLAVIRAIELYIGALLTIQETADMINDLISLGKLSKHAGLNSTASYSWLGKYMGDLFKRKISVSQIGAIGADNSPFTWAGEKNPKYNFVQLKNSCINSKGESISHWTLADETGEEIYNSFKGELKDCKVHKRYLLNVEVGE